MVTWGSNTTFNIPGSAGSQSSSATPSSAPKTTSLFGSTPSPAPASAFSFSSPAPSGGLFSPTLTTSSTFGTTTTASPATNPYAHMLGAPQQAALQAHMTASMNQETSRIEQQLTQLKAAFSPFQIPTAPNQINTISRFQHIFYDPMTEAQKLERLALPSYPPKPSHISDETWQMALACNPDPENYIPVLVSSAEGLHSRIVSQQSMMKLHDKYLSQISDTIRVRGETVNESIQYQIDEYNRKNIMIRQRLLRIMQKFEIARGKNIPLQASEKEAFSNLRTLYQHSLQGMKMVEVVKRECMEYSRQLHMMQMKSIHRRRHVSLDDGVKKEAMDILKSNKAGIDELTKRVQKDERDVNLMMNGNI